ncbi:MAG: hypothetical protein FWF34_02120 [Alphaproteobacteria bacterium]|nr:hypothetical protein [Alphaproteobacteria bacterium]MCL2890028.1 hypothetical protein [Alphaproteobacteria bacterium]
MTQDKTVDIYFGTLKTKNTELGTISVTDAENFSVAVSRVPSGSCITQFRFNKEHIQTHDYPPDLTEITFTPLFWRKAKHPCCQSKEFKTLRIFISPAQICYNKLINGKCKDSHMIETFGKRFFPEHYSKEK